MFKYICSFLIHLIEGAKTQSLEIMGVYLYDDTVMHIFFLHL